MNRDLPRVFILALSCDWCTRPVTVFAQPNAVLAWKEAQLIGWRVIDRKHICPACAKLFLKDTP